MVACSDPESARRLRIPGIQVLAGPGGLEEVATLREADIVINALVGAVGLGPTVRAIQAGKRVALANKESLVMGGELVMGLIAERPDQLIPVDSEHSAIFQCLQGHHAREQITRIILTASGGPFLKLPAEKLNSVSPRQALSHPTWEMGRKVTIDSATLMNKGLEVIEAHWLFGTPISQIEVLIHEQSIVHSLVEFSDNSVLAQMSIPDMRLPIQYALTYPRRKASPQAPLDLARVGVLTFLRPDGEKFPCLQLAYDAAEMGGSMTAVLNAANEEAVGAFLAHNIGFTDIPRVISETMGQHRLLAQPDLEEIQAADSWARETAQKQISQLARCRTKQSEQK
jgi:1-deoxy-D-xylulose-5-phosphate reductoisomerase